MKFDIIRTILQKTNTNYSFENNTLAYAPANIALCKYWGKRNEQLNLPYTSSLSISLGNKGTTTSIKILSSSDSDIIFLNDQQKENDSVFATRLISFLNLFRPSTTTFFEIKTYSTIPIAAGLASSASGYAALVLALNKLFKWELSFKELSILARLGSGSACRSLWHGFVKWHAGYSDDGMDSYAEPLKMTWPDLCIGLLILSTSEKNPGSTIAMKKSLASDFFSSWLEKSKKDLSELPLSIEQHDFSNFGRIVESNALAMHSVTHTTWPPIYYSLPETIANMHLIWAMRKSGIELYFTQDAGPNLKLMFLKKDVETIKKYFKDIEIIFPFSFE